MPVSNLSSFFYDLFLQENEKRDSNVKHIDLFLDLDEFKRQQAVLKLKEEKIDCHCVNPPHTETAAATLLET